MTFTVLARASTPRSSAACLLVEQKDLCHLRTPLAVTTARMSRALKKEQQLLVVVLDLGAAVFAEDHDVTLGNIEGDSLSVVVNAARTGCEYLALLGLLLRGVGNDQARGRGLLGFERLNEDAILEWLDRDCHVKPLSQVICPDMCTGRDVVAGAISAASTKLAHS